MEHLVKAILQLSGITLLRYFILAGLAFALFYVFLPSKFKRAKIQQRAARRKDFTREILHSMATSLVLSVIGGIVLYTPFRDYTLIYPHLGDHPWWWLPVGLALSLVIHDTYFYWMHRLLHHPRIFKYTHLVHHQSVNPSPFASYSFHILEAIAEGGVVIFLSFVLPMHPLTLILFVVLGFIINVYGHLGYEIMPKGLRRSFLFSIINTSVYHNLHHSKFKGNYSLYFRWWDLWMGTANPDYEKEYDRIQEQRFGNPKQYS
jgi:sterol desaturase/sphingolipid hydroxylase (fatty acid hydroxylase superfamily)